ncbi:MAG: iron ABC transporter permease [Flavobacteriales bacterium]|nr:iron ABC transporter permease [Flavobacteriales bacterium]
MDRSVMAKQRLLLGFSVLLVLNAVGHLAWGPMEISLWEALTWAEGSNSVESVVMYEVRLPRVLTAMAGGAGLALSGLLLQTWFHNPLAGPSVLGISSGASMGVALVVLSGWSWGWMGVSASATLGGLFSLMLILGVSRRFSGVAALLIFGLMLNYVLGALVTVLQAEAQQDALQQFVFWGMGTFGQAPLSVAAGLSILVIIAGVWMLGKSRALDAWTLGSLTARSMGVHEGRLQWTVIGTTGILAGCITAICGPVAFLGLATPHLVRLVTSERSHKRLIPLTIVAGSLLALVADWGVRGPGLDGGGWPLNAVLSLLGGPLVIWVLFRKTWNA